VTDTSAGNKEMPSMIPFLFQILFQINDRFFLAKNTSKSYRATILGLDLLLNLTPITGQLNNGEQQ
jgi:hypothetical protein